MFSLFDSSTAAAFLQLVAAITIKRETLSLVRQNTGAYRLL